jgi:hypothetical protein
MRWHYWLLVPRNRVIRGSGELGGYRWGLARKRALIDQKRAHRPHFDRPSLRIVEENAEGMAASTV